MQNGSYDYLNSKLRVIGTRKITDKLAKGLISSIKTINIYKRRGKTNYNSKECNAKN